ncbi:MAG TPA: hypothetical protein VGA41_08365 [Candidatus Dormibacteraeota bacterium]
MDVREIVLLVTVVLLILYVIGIGGATATAIRINEAWRRRPAPVTSLGPRSEGEVVLEAPVLPALVRRLRLVGWVVFPIALVLAVFANRSFPWMAPLAVLVMVGLNAFYFTAMQGMGEPLTLTKDGFRLGVRGRERSVRWVHVTDLVGARLGAFSGTRMSESGEWQDPKLKPNVIFFRLNRALVHSPKTLLQRLRGFSYYDGAIRNAFGVPTEQLLRAMREWQRVAIDAESPPFRRPRPGERAG